MVVPLGPFEATQPTFGFEVARGVQNVGSDPEKENARAPVDGSNHGPKGVEGNPAQGRRSRAVTHPDEDVRRPDIHNVFLGQTR